MTEGERMITFFDIRCFLWDCWIAVKVRLFPDKRPAPEIFAEVRERLGHMPAGKEIHKVFTLLDEAEKAGADPIAPQRPKDDDTIEDGFGGVWSAWCPECGNKSMAVMRPGKVQCGNCG